MLNNSGLLVPKLNNARRIIEAKKQDYPEEQYSNLIKSLDRFTSAVVKINRQLSNASLSEKQEDKYIESLKKIAANICKFGNKWGLSNLNDVPVIVATQPTINLSTLERKMLKKLNGGQKLLDLLDNQNVPIIKKISTTEEARVALDALRRGEKVEEVSQTIDTTGKKAGKKNKGEIDILTETEIIEVKGSAKYATIEQPDSDLKVQVEKYIQKVKKDANVNPSKPQRKIVIHLTVGASNGVIDWFALKASRSGVIIEVRTGQR
ncbi:hypothetical protein NIES4071_30070 [Calothrix sp. NIES-4071]|nr:hypothetical protein NIES4071_30070 [Calothrix sp. NIES-4071]BAZ57327.1 hypothetical protein NIES4105_30010 [Calothrix sp. NIES-4105]